MVLTGKNKLRLPLVFLRLWINAMSGEATPSSLAMELAACPLVRKAGPRSLAAGIGDFGTWRSREGETLNTRFQCSRAHPSDSRHQLSSRSRTLLVLTELEQLPQLH
ncbi:hypothetical protein QBC34DRAFT_101353 [Podospora aff. communis PSN243]|uniref:Secreted protein n=1 Tax=Podospora aff. communis PSN243 TaxID=3040156 RepID=A0AAV9GQM5_9PEZI|nr:hypothetical protein QBC34DRAFT_101353 [Podospora aff. communis PSN243]